MDSRLDREGSCPRRDQIEPLAGPESWCRLLHGRGIYRFIGDSVRRSVVFWPIDPDMLIFWVPKPAAGPPEHKVVGYQALDNVPYVRKRREAGEVAYNDASTALTNCHLCNTS